MKGIAFITAAGFLALALTGCSEQNVDKRPTAVDTTPASVQVQTPPANDNKTEGQSQ